MGQRPPDSASSPSTLWRIRYSPATSGAAVILFLVLSALWLASSIRGGQSVWHAIGIVGLVLTLVSLVSFLWSFTHRRGEVRTASHGGMTALAICIGVFVELILGLLVLSPTFAVA